MKRLFLWVTILVLALSSFEATSETDAPLRLHIVADSNDEDAQTLKIKVRDAVLRKTQSMLSQTQKSEEAYQIIVRELRSLRLCARQAARREGYTGAIRVKIAREDFPARRYGTVLLPEGSYRALKVEIGAREGHNWWCVLFPSLCLYGAEREGRMQFYSSIRTWINRVFKGETGE